MDMPEHTPARGATKNLISRFDDSVKPSPPRTGASSVFGSPTQPVATPSKVSFDEDDAGCERAGCAAATRNLRSALTKAEAKALDIATHWEEGVSEQEARHKQVLAGRAEKLQAAVKEARQVLALRSGKEAIGRVLEQLELDGVDGLRALVEDAVAQEIAAAAPVEVTGGRGGGRGGGGRGSAAAARQIAQLREELRVSGAGRIAAVEEAQRLMSSEGSYRQQIAEAQGEAQRMRNLASEAAQKLMSCEERLQESEVDREAVEIECEQVKQQAVRHQQTLERRAEKILLSHRQALNWVAAVGEAPQTALLEDASGPQTWSGAITQVTIEQLGDIGIKFATAPDGRVLISAVDAASRNANAASAALVIGQQLLSVDGRRVTELPTRVELCQRPLVLTFALRTYQHKLPMIALPEGFPPGCVQIEKVRQMEAQLEQASLAAENIREELIGVRTIFGQRTRAVRVMQNHVRASQVKWRSARQLLLTNQRTFPAPAPPQYRCLKVAKLRQSVEMSSAECGQVDAGEVITVL